MRLIDDTNGYLGFELFLGAVGKKSNEQVSARYQEGDTSFKPEQTVKQTLNRRVELDF